MNSMDNFFNYISKPINKEDIDTWFKINNILPEKLELYYDFSFSLYDLIRNTFLGENENFETKINMTEEDVINHFKWCWNKTIENFRKENIFFENNEETFLYFKNFFMEVYYNQEQDIVKKSLQDFFIQIFNKNNKHTKSDIEMFTELYKLLEKSLQL